MPPPAFRLYETNRLPLLSHRGQVIHQLETDISGTKDYRINALGMRGEDFDVAAQKRAYVFGCSLSFGIGLNEEEIWHHHFFERYCRWHHTSRTQANMLNFGQSGASNQVIARSTLVECAVHAPDLALIQMTYPERYEMAYGEGVVHIGPWYRSADWLPEDVKEAAGDHYRNYREEQGTMDLVRNILLIQSFLAARHIDYFMVVACPFKKTTVVTRQLLRLVDFSRTLWVPRLIARLEKQGSFNFQRQSPAADGLHHGPVVHELVGDFAWQKYAAMHGDQVPATVPATARAPSVAPPIPRNSSSAPAPQTDLVAEAAIRSAKLKERLAKLGESDPFSYTTF